jgi:protein SCO1
MRHGRRGTTLNARTRFFTRAGLPVLFALMSLPLSAAERSASFYQLHEKLLNQDGKAIDLDVYRGKKVLVTLFYGSCPATCPLIIDTLRAVEKKVSEPQRQDLRVLLVSMDPERDTPAALRKLADTRRIDTTRWTLAHADAPAVRRIAAALSVQYKKLPDGQFSHSTIISALDADGKILVQSAELGHADPELVEAIIAK